MDQLELRKSTIKGAGLGVFAKEDLLPGYIINVIGLSVSRGGIHDKCTSFANSHKFVINKNTLLIPYGFGGMVNHSDNPNMEKVVDKKLDMITLITTRAIKAGEELFWKYLAKEVAKFKGV